MDILKKASGNLAACRINGGCVEILGKAYPGDTPVVFPIRLSKSYTLAAALFYLLNGSLPIVEYVARCQHAGVPQVSYRDQAAMRAAVASYTASEVGGFFVPPVYTHRRAYDLPRLSSTVYIIVSGDIASAINIDNAAQLLAGPSRDASNPHSLTAGGRHFEMRDNPMHLTDAEWGGVRAVFLDGTSSQTEGWSSRLSAIAKHAAIFSYTGRDPGSTRVSVEGDRIRNLEEVWAEINMHIN